MRWSGGGQNPWGPFNPNGGPGGGGMWGDPPEPTEPQFGGPKPKLGRPFEVEPMTPQNDQAPMPQPFLPGGGNPSGGYRPPAGAFAKRSWMPDLFAQRMQNIAQLYGPKGMGWANMGVPNPWDPKPQQPRGAATPPRTGGGFMAPGGPKLNPGIKVGPPQMETPPAGFGPPQQQGPPPMGQSQAPQPFRMQQPNYRPTSTWY